MSLPLFVNPYSRYNFEPDKAALLRAVVVLLVLFLLIEYPGHRRTINRLPILLALILWGLVSLATAFSLESGRSFWGEARWSQGWITLTAFYLIFSLAAWTLNAQASRERLVTAILFGGAVVSLYGLAQALGVDPLRINPPWERIQSTLPHANVLGGYLAMLLPFTIYRIASGRLSQRPLWIGVLVLQGSCLMLTVSRSSWLGAYVALCSMIVVWAWHARKLRLAMITAGVALTGGVALMTLSLLPAPRPEDPFIWQAVRSLFRPDGPTAQIRLMVWGAIIRAIQARPWLGYGPETFDLALPRYAPAQLALLGNLKAVAGRGHNEILELALYAGIPAAATYVLLLIVSLRAGWRRWRRGDRLALPLMAGAVAGLVHHLLDVTSITTGAFSWLMLGMLIASDPLPQAYREPILPPKARPVAWIAALGAIAAIAFWPVAAESVGRRALALISVGAWEEADKAINRAERLDPRPHAYADTHADLLLARLENGDAVEASALAVGAARLEWAITDTPGDLELWRRLVLIRQAQAMTIHASHWPLAFQACQSMLRQAPANPDSYLLCGDLRLNARQPAGALPYYRSAAELAPAYDQPFYNLATVYRWLGDESQARAYSAIAERNRETWEQAIRQR